MNPQIERVISARPDMLRLAERAAEQGHWEPGMRIIEMDGGIAGRENYFRSVQKLDITRVSAGGVTLESMTKSAADKAYGPEKFAAASDLQDICDSFDGAYIEKAFSPAKDKSNICKFLRKVLAPGAKVIVNDFVFLQDDGNTRTEREYIPCFPGVQPHQCYEQLFLESGFKCLASVRDDSEMIRLGLWLCKEYGIQVSEIGFYLSRCYGSDAYSCKGSRGCRYYGQEKMTCWNFVFENT